MARTLITQADLNSVEVYWHRLREFIIQNDLTLSAEIKRALLYEHRVIEMNINQ